MASMKSKVFNWILKYSPVKKSLQKAFETGEFGKRDVNEPPKKLFSDDHIEKKQIDGKDGKDGKNVFTLKPKNESSEKYILYLHGGAYVQGFSMIHWRFLKHLMHETKCTIIAPDYPLAPNFTYLDSFEMVEPLYKELVSQVGGENVILMGDSSGGGFALALAQSMKEEVPDFAKQIILLSPWLDITMENKEIKEIDLKDPILGINGLKMAGKAYAGATDPNHYLLSPINGDVKGLGKISVFIGTRDILEADARKFKSITEEKGVDINYFEYQDMPHVWMFFNLLESKKAFGQIVDLIVS